jgi:hypothetical protein
MSVEERFKRLFGGRPGVRLHMWPTGEVREDGKEKWGGRTEHQDIDWGAHLAGKKSYGPCIVLEDNTSRHGCFDIDQYAGGKGRLGPKSVKKINDRL